MHLNTFSGEWFAVVVLAIIVVSLYNKCNGKTNGVQRKANAGQIM